MQQSNERQKNGSSESLLTDPPFGGWSKLIGQFPSPESSMKQLIASHQRNCEAASKMAALVTESMSTVFQHQVDAAGALAKDGLSVLNRIVETATSKEKLVIQTEWTKNRLETGICNLRHLSSIVTAANLEAGNVLAKRLNEAFEEFSPAP